MASIEPVPDAPAQPAKSHYRSWRKKFRKMKLRFDEKMKEGTNLCREEIKAKDIARRLQEQNDRLLDMLLEVNDSIHIPPNLRFNLLAPAETPSLSAVPELESDDPAYLKLKLVEAQQQVKEGRLSNVDFADFEKTINTSIRTRDTAPLISLESKVPHTDPTHPSTAAALSDRIDDILNINDSNKDGYGYLNPDHADLALLELDTALGDPFPSRQLPLISAPEPEPTEKDIQANNPVSVQNYLRRYHPQIFLQDAENALAEKAPREGGTKRAGGKRAPRGGAALESKMDLDEDEFGVIPETTTSGRKRARGDDDGSYRPKGGTSRPAKKRKAEGDGEGGGRGKKKPRASNGPMHE
ncbi:MAG: hypothetical protein M1820_002572 [Bogoriella megaspora]|nr:MAG: hypothetical protein M1820_002572 [Bogoriella megaspora]